MGERCEPHVDVAVVGCGLRWITAWACLLALAGALVSPLPSARAEEPRARGDGDVARVRALFAQGLEFVDGQRWSDAEERFRQCLSIRRSPVIEYNLASALEAQGELAEAATLLRGIVAEPEVPRALREASAARLEQLEPRLAYLTVVVSGASDGAVVSLDGRMLPAERVGARWPIDPGRHEVAARSRSSAALVAIAAEAGESLEVELALHAPPEEAFRLALDEEPREAVDPPRRRRRALWASFGATMFGTLFAAVLLSRDDAEKAAQPRDYGVSVELAP